MKMAAPLKQLLLTKQNLTCSLFARLSSLNTIKQTHTLLFVRHKLLNVCYVTRSVFYGSFRWTCVQGTFLPRKRSFCVSASLVAAVFAKSKDEAYEEEIILCVKKAKLAEMKGKFEDADQMYHKALDILADYEAKGLWEADMLLQSRTYVYDHMGNLALARRDLRGAESLFKETMKGLLEQGYREDHNSIMEISLKLAMIFAMQGEFEKAEEGYRHIVEVQTKKVEADKYSDTNSVSLLGMFANSYSRFLLFRERYSEARVHMDTALEMAKKSLGEDHVQIPVLYSDIGNIASMQNCIEEALEHMKMALDLARRIDSPDIPVFLCNMGDLCLKRGDIDQAKRYCQEAIKLAKQNGDEDSAKMAKICVDNAKSKQK